MSAKIVTIFYYGSDAGRAADMAKAERAKLNGAITRDAVMFDGENEPCTRVVITPGVRKQHADRIRAAYGDKVVNAPVATAAAQTQAAGATAGGAGPPPAVNAPAGRETLRAPGRRTSL